MSSDGVLLLVTLPDSVYPGEGEVLPLMDYIGRLRPKGVSFSGWRYIKGWRFCELKYRKGLETDIWVLKGTFKISQTDTSKHFKGFLK